MSTLKWIEKFIQWIDRHQAVIMIIVTVSIAASTCQMVEVNKQLTKITDEFYEYHPPNITVTYGQVTKLYVLRNESCGTYISLVGLAHVYNSGTADDVAVIRQKGLGLVSNLPATRKEEEIVKVYSEDQLYQILVTTRIDEVDEPASEYFEGSPYQVAVIPGASPVEMPILITSRIDKVIESNATIELIIEEGYARLEVIHPTTKELIGNITSLEPINITYKMGEGTADAETIDGRTLIMDVRCTENVDTYIYWKKTFMHEHGIKGALFLISPPH